jgi:hypothetical protein
MGEKHLLPKQQGSAWLKPVGSSIEANVLANALELKVSVEGYDATGIVDASNCHLNLGQIEGCYSCEAGATLNGTCSTDFGTASATVECSSEVFAVKCTPEGKEEVINLHFETAAIDMECTVFCPASTAKARLVGSLVSETFEANKFGNVEGTSQRLKYGLGVVKWAYHTARKIIDTVVDNPILLLLTMPLLAPLIFLCCGPILWRALRVVFRYALGAARGRE